jgi:hypothetical protein
MKQTAVEWGFQELDNYYQMKSKFKSKKEILEQAKEMEKQQIIEAGNSCAFKQHLHSERMWKMSIDEILEFALEETITFGEEYYNETFNK